MIDSALLCLGVAIFLVFWELPAFFCFSCFFKILRGFCPLLVTF